MLWGAIVGGSAAIVAMFIVWMLGKVNPSLKKIPKIK